MGYKEKQALYGLRKKYLTASVLVAGAAAIYELFSHGVYSIWMMGAFLVPLLLGALPVQLALKKDLYIGLMFGKAADAFIQGIAWLTAACLIKGVLDIYGTTNPLISIYWIVAGLFMTLALAISRRKADA